MTGRNHVYHYKHGWIPLDSYAAARKLQRTKGSAHQLAARHGLGHDVQVIEHDPKLETLANLHELAGQAGPHSRMQEKLNTVLQRHQAEHGAKSSAEKLAEVVHNPGVRHEERPPAALTSAEKIAARATGKPSGHVAAAMERGNLPEHLRAPVAAALAHQAKYPGLLEHVRTVTVTPKGKSWDASYGNHKLDIKPDLFDPDGAFQRDRKAQRAAEMVPGRVPNTWFAKIKAVDEGRATWADAVIAHEVGHAAEQRILPQGRLDAFTAMSRAAGLPEPQPVMRHFDDGGPPEVNADATIAKWAKSDKVRTVVARQVSTYANSNPNEAFAEMWSVYSLDGADSPPLIRAFGDSVVASLARRAAMR